MIILKKIPVIYPRRNVTCIAFTATAALVAAMIAGGIPVKKHPLEPWQYVSPESAFTKGKLWELLQDSRFKYIAVVTFLVSPTGSNQTFNVPPNWNSGNNIVESIGAGASGGSASSNTFFSDATGGGGGAYSAQTNIALVPGGTATYQIGSGGIAVFTNINASNGNSGGDSWFNGATLGASSVGAKGGSAGLATFNSSIGGGVGGIAGSGIGAIRNSGGAGGNITSNVSNATGGGGAAGLNGNGNNGVNTGVSTATAGGSGDAGSGGSGGSGVVGNPPGGTGGNGTEFDGSHGSGGGGGGNYGAGISITATGGSGGLYGGGGGGAAAGTTATSGAGIQGLIVVTNTPGTHSIFAGIIG